MEPNIKIWYYKHIPTSFDIKLFYHLLDLILYLGIVCLLSKIDYWKDYNIWPCHPIMYEMGMSRDRFLFLWIHFHISSVDLPDVENEQDDCYVGGNEDLEENSLTG